MLTANWRESERLRAAYLRSGRSCDSIVCTAVRAQRGACRGALFIGRSQAAELRVVFSYSVALCSIRMTGAM